MCGFLTSNQQHSGRRGQSGSVLLETALVISLVLVPMTLGVVTVGLNLIRAIQANQINRDSGHMFARGVDFSSVNGAVNRAVLFKKIAPPLDPLNPKAVLVLTSVWYLGPVSCPGCANSGCVVYTRQIVLGKLTDKPKAHPVGTVNSTIMDADGLVIVDATKDPLARAQCGSSDFPTGARMHLQMQDGDRAYIADTYFSSADLVIPGGPNLTGVVAHAFF